MKFLYLFAAIFAVAATDVFKDMDVDTQSRPQFYVHEHPKVLLRYRRDVSIDPKTGDLNADHKVGQNGKVFGQLGGTEDALYGKAGYQHTLIDDGRGKLDARAFGTRVLSAYGDSSSLGGGLTWQDRHAQAAVDISRQIGGRTSMHAEGGGRWPTGRNSDFSLQGTYDQTFGRRPDYGVLGNWRYRFP